MIYKYELACKEAGLSEEKIKEIRKIFEDEKDVRRNNKKKKERYGIIFNSIDALTKKYHGDCMELLADDFDLEELIILRSNLEKLNEGLEELSADDREFLFALYGNERTMADISRELGIPRSTLNDRKKKLLEKLKNKF